MAYKSYDRNIFGRKINTPHKNIREASTPTAVSAMNEIAAIVEGKLQVTFDNDQVKEGYRNILLVLGVEDGVSQLSIANKTDLKPSTVSIALKKMERDGYITRINDMQDMRMSRVYLTEMGLEVANRAYQITEDTAAVLMQGISAEELDIVMRVAEKMKANYKANQNEQ